MKVNPKDMMIYVFFQQDYLKEKDIVYFPNWSIRSPGMNTKDNS